MGCPQANYAYVEMTKKRLREADKQKLKVSADPLTIPGGSHGHRHQPPRPCT
jgi:hypothetical protein